MRRAVLASAILGLAALQAAAQPRRRTVTVLTGSEGGALLSSAHALVESARRGAADVDFKRFSSAELADPIRKGRLLSQLHARDLVIAVGDEAAAFTTGELDDTPVYFVNASVVRGDALASPTVSGTFSYSVDRLLDAAKGLGPRLGVVYTPGYEPLVRWLRRAAAKRGLALQERKVTAARELAPAARALLETASAVWVAGDPLLVRGAGFEFLRERSITRRVPLIAGGENEVRSGALLSFEADAAALNRQASADVDAALRGAAHPDDRLRPAPAAGTLLVNGALLERWKLTPPAGSRVVR